MLNTIKTMALSALIGFGALAAVPVAAQADGIYLNFGRQNDHRVGVTDGVPPRCWSGDAGKW